MATTESSAEGAAAKVQRFSPSLMHSAATLYYLQDVTQADIAERLGISRATVSRVLSEARRQGIVRIDVVDPGQSGVADLQDAVAEALDLRAVYLSTGTSRGSVGAGLASSLGKALMAVGLQPGDVVLVSSGRTIYEATRTALPALPGVIVAPMLGGQNEPEPWYQTNEIVREFAVRVGGTPHFLYAPALPAAKLHRTLLEDPSTRAVLDLWESARCAVVGVGAPPLGRASLPTFVAREAALGSAVGDVVSRFFDSDGTPIAFAGSAQLISTSLESLRAVPASIALASGPTKVEAILAAARAGYISQLVTDVQTARSLLAVASGS